MKLSQLKIDPEFQSKIPPLQFEEEQQLEQNIIAEGRLLNPIITWNGYILDGHTRYRILKKHGFIKFEVEEIQLANKYEALAWICKNQLGRRNLSPERKKFLLGKEYESTKLAVGAPLGSKHGIRKCGQNDHIFTESRTCQRIASEHGVGEKTVRRAEKYSQGIDAAEEAVPGAQEEILTGHIKATDEQIVALASIPKEERPAILEELKKKKSDRDDTVLERLKPSKPPPKPKSAPQKKKPTATENNTTSQAEQPETPVQAPITESPPEEEIEPTSNAPPSFLQSIINEAWKGNVDSYLAGVIRGVARFISVYEGEYSRERLVQQLARTHPKTITQLAQKDTGSSANRHMRQIFTIDKSRIERFMGYASKAEMLRIDMALLVSLALNVLSGNRSE